MDTDKEFNKRKRRRRLRRALISKLIHDVLAGEFDNTSALTHNLYNDRGGARRQYYGPNDRSSFNYGYMEMKEMQSPNN